MIKIAAIFGTRPDTIKLAPVINEIKKHKKEFRITTIATAQHREMLDQVLDVFKIKPDYDLNIMKPGQSLALVTRNIIDLLDAILIKEKPDLILVQGDTTTTFAASLAAFYRKIPVGHVEAGLRTDDKYNPFPEEINRRLTGVISELHFAPTETSQKALLKENTPAAHIYITGNTVIDALNIAVKKNYKFTNNTLRKILGNGRQNILITMHRRENWGMPMKNACRAVKKMALEFPEHNFIFPVHLNPLVKETVHSVLAGMPNVFLINPLDYLEFTNLMSKCILIITDSGGVQEEGPHFGIPILVLREKTERPEAVKYGTVKLVGLNEERIYKTAKNLLKNKRAYNKMASAVNPYGDGLASQRIVKILRNYFGLSAEKVKQFIPK